MTTLDAARRAIVAELIDREWPKLERYFSTKLPPAEVEDVAQATILAYVENLDAVRSDPRAYLWQIARNQVARHWERRLARRGVAFDSATHTIHDVGPTLSSLVGKRHAIAAALLELPLDAATALELRHLHGLSIEEICRVLKVSPATVHRHLTRAEQHLAMRLGPDAGEQLRRAADE